MKSYILYTIMIAQLCACGVVVAKYDSMYMEQIQRCNDAVGKAIMLKEALADSERRNGNAYEFMATRLGMSDDKINYAFEWRK